MDDDIAACLGTSSEAWLQQRLQLSREFDACRTTFVALGDETRQLIFTALLENPRLGMRVGEITERTNLSRPAVSHHLRILKDAGLIGMHRQGTMNYYYVDAGRSELLHVKALVDHICAVMAQAAAEGCPLLESARSR